MRNLLVISIMSCAAAATADEPKVKAASCKRDVADLAAWLKATAKDPYAAKVEPSSVHQQIVDAVRPTDPSQKAPLLSKSSGKGIPGVVFKSCPAVEKWMPSLASLAPPARLARIVAQLPAQLEACGCEAELAAVKELAHQWLLDDKCASDATDLAAWLKLANAQPGANVPPPSSIHDDLEKVRRPVDASKKAPLLDSASDSLPDRVFKQCDSIKKTLSLLSGQPLAEKRARLVSDLAGLVHMCRCQADLPAVRELAHHWLSTWR